MYKNQLNEAVIQPAVYSLRRMTHQGPLVQGSKGSYEMYDQQQSGSLGEKRLNGISGPAPGSPGSVHDYKQIVLNLQRELEESKRKGAELQQIIADFNGGQANDKLVDSQFFDGSTSNNSLGDSVKDAYIKHLQRQVTVLQAALHKSDGWVNRVGASMKERDNAVDDLARLTNQIKDMEVYNQEMQHKISYLTAALQESQQNLQKVNSEIHNQPNNGQMVAQLQEEVHKQKAEIAKLVQSIHQLDQENRSLKDSGFLGSSQSLSNLACSQELEHLHVVVDKLKSIVLEQRSYLLQLKKPSSIKKSTSACTSNDNGNMSSDLVPGQPSSPRMRHSGSDISQGQRLLGVNNTAGLKSAASKENLLEPSRMSLSAPSFTLEGVGGSGRKLSSQDVLKEMLQFEDMSPQQPSPGFVVPETRPRPQPSTNTYVVENLHRKSPDYLGKNGSGDVPEKTVEQLVGSQNSAVKVKPPLNAAAKSEVVVQKQNQAPITNWGSRSEIVNQSTYNWNESSENKNPYLGYKLSGGDTDKFVPVSPALTINNGQRFLPGRTGQKEVVEMSRSVSDVQELQVGGSVTMQAAGDENGVEYENVSRNSPTFQIQQMHQPPPLNSQRASAHTVSDAVKREATLQPPAPCGGALQRPGQDVVYVNTPVQSINGHHPTSSIDPDDRSQQNSDKLCPVCNHDYSHISMEDFQSHVLDCFDDDNPPETITPDSPQRLCPMCNAAFGQETTQVNFEKHVHSHFGEDFVGSPFEMLS